LALFPLKSQFELPDDQPNQFLHVDEYEAAVVEQIEEEIDTLSKEISIMVFLVLVGLYLYYFVSRRNKLGKNKPKKSAPSSDIESGLKNK